MVKSQKVIFYVIILIIPTIIGLILISPNAFFSWLFIELWFFYTVKFFQKRKYYREFNSPHNTSFFILTPFIVGMFYSFWGYYAETGTNLEKNMFEEGGYALFLSIWNLIFALPYLLYCLYSLHACFRKFDLVYLIRNKYVKARLFGFFYAIFFISFGLLILIVVKNYFYLIPLQLTQFYLDFSLLITIILSGLIPLIYGLILRKPSLPQITPSLIAQRRRSIDNIRTQPIRSSPRRESRTRPIPTTAPPSRLSRRTSRSSAPPQRARSTVRSPAPRTVASSTARNQQPSSNISVQSHKTQPEQKKINYEKYRPLGTALSTEDFKCIFCFKLPEIPADDKRGIVLCPNCKHPAHADEFYDWLKASNLCSRCGATIPNSFRRSPELISARNYLEIFKHYSKR